MNIEIKERFMEAWEKYFPCRELPLVCYYTEVVISNCFPATAGERKIEEIPQRFLEENRPPLAPTATLFLRNSIGNLPAVQAGFTTP